MIGVEEYAQRVLALAAARSLSVERVPLGRAVGRVLAEPVAARFAVPPFDNSAMDGFAVRAADVGSVPVWLDVVGESAAASGSIPAVTPGTAVRVMTGGRIPPGADAVVPVELTDSRPGPVPLPPRIRIDEAVSTGLHVRRAADDLAAGDPVLPAGAVLTAAAVAALASVGHGEAPVVARPRVAVISTGTELVEPGRALMPGQIPDSNSLLLAALALGAGAEVVAARRCGDEPGALARALAELGGVDVVVTSGGVSAGAYEPVRQLGGSVEFSAVAMQPGKPQGCGLVDGVPLVAFPGNPVSAFVSFHVFGVPLLDALTGAARRRREWVAPALQGWRSPAGRRQYVPVVLEADGVRPSHRRGSGSHLIGSLHLAGALAVVPADSDEVGVGDRLRIMGI